MKNEDGFTVFELGTGLAVLVWLVVVIAAVCVAGHFIGKYW